MKPINITPGPGQQLIIHTAPRGWDAETYGACVDLQTVFDPTFKTCTSAWVPTSEELALLNAGNPVFVQIVGGQPAMLIFVEDTRGVQITQTTEPKVPPADEGVAETDNKE